MISIVLPAYNEAKRIKKAVERVINTAKSIGYDFEVIIAEDGSTDGTDKIASELAKKYAEVRHIHSNERLGRGRALKNAFKEAKGDIVVYMDVDLSTDLKHLKELVDSIAVEGYDIATGSRLLKDSKAERPVKRAIASKVYNSLVRLLLGSKIKDHQCGFKAFKRDVILKICEDVKDNHWFWDTEVLVLAQKRGYKVKEIPVVWKQSEDTKVRFGRDSLYMFSQIFRMWLEEKRSDRKYMVISTLSAILIMLLLAYFAGFEKVFENIVRVKPKFLVYSAVVYVLSYFLRGYRFEYILSRLDSRSSIIFSTQSIAISQTVNVLTPIRIGDLARAYVFKRIDVPYTTSLAAIATERLFDLLSISLIAVFSAVAIGMMLSTPMYAMVFTILLFLAVFLLSRMENVIGKILKDVKRVLKFKDSLVILAFSIILWFSDILVCYLIALSYVRPSILLISLAVAIANIVKALPITPGGIGTYEAAMTLILSKLSTDIAFTIALVDHALKNVLTVLLGFVSLASLNISLKDLRK